MFGILIFSECSVVSQSKQENAEKSFEKALEAIRVNDQRNAIKYAEKAIEQNRNFLEPYLLLAEVHNYRDNIDKTIYYYEKAFELDSLYDLNISLYLSFYNFDVGKYYEAKRYIDFYYKYADKFAPKNLDSDRLKKFIEFALHSIENPVDFEPINIGPGVNTRYNEYWPSLSVDESVLVFTRQIPENPDTYDGRMSSMFEGLFVSFLTENGWSNSRALPGGVNPRYNQGAQCISADGNTIIFTSCDRMPGGRRCDLYITFMRGGDWTRPKNMTSVNSNSWDSNPSLTADGRTLYFASARKGGIEGGSNIWVVDIDNEGEAINEPKCLGEPVNTEYSEVSPFIHPDGKSLYFASNGHIGMGDFDLFVSRKEYDGSWGKPVNLGYPINTYGEERSLIVNARGNIAMFASAREPDKGLDIYYFEIPDEMKPTPVTYVRGITYDFKTNKPLSANMELIDLATEKIISKQISEQGTGKYLVCLPIDKDYAFNVSKSGYMFYSENFSLTNLEDPEKPYIMNIPLNPIEKGATVVMRNIFFDFNSYQLLPESFAELNKITEFLTENKHIKIEIGGHTDNVGTKVYNQTLSENRAKAVYTYLIKKGIDAKRMSYKGYDFSKPIADNETEEGRAKNRRTEFKIIEI